MVKLSFSTTSFCETQQQFVNFTSSSEGETVIEGASISLGTDPEGNFTLRSVKIGTGEIPAVNGVLNDIHVPPDTDYSFVVAYTPRTEDASHAAMIDIAYAAPKAGIVQVSLEGSSAGRSSSCLPPSTTVKLSALPAAFPPKLPFKITRIALVTNALPVPITTDPESTVTPYQWVAGVLLVDSERHTVMLPPIPEIAECLLPPNKGVAGEAIAEDILVTSTSPATGTYGNDGSLTIENIPLHLKERFEADFDVTLTTQEADPKFLPKNLLRTAGFTVTEEGKITGSPIDLKTMEATLVGVSTFTNPKGEGMVAQTIGGSLGALLLTVKLEMPANPPAAVSDAAAAPASP